MLRPTMLSLRLFGISFSYTFYTHYDAQHIRKSYWIDTDVTIMTAALLLLSA